MLKSLVIHLFTLLLLACSAQNKKVPPIDLSKFSDGIHHWELYSKIRSVERWDTTDVLEIADNLLAFQNSDGGWPKNIDWLTQLTADSVKGSLSVRYKSSTLDNRNTFPQIEYLAKVYTYTRQVKYKKAAVAGFEYILKLQYPQGGWRGWDADAITFNDDVMTGVMAMLLEVKIGADYYQWIPAELHQRLIEAYEKGLEVILKCQIEVDGIKTAWCQQHHPLSYQPVKGRSYELPSITARESSDIVLFLMKIPQPDKRIISAVENAIAWFKAVQINGYSYRDVSIPEQKYHETTINFDREFVPDSLAKAVWARYYDLNQSKPFLCLRSGEIVYHLSQIPFDRRVGYAWYGFWPQKVFEVYQDWRYKRDLNH